MVELVAKVLGLFVKVILFLQRLTQQLVVLRQQNRHLIDQITFVFLQCRVPLLQDLTLVVQLAQLDIQISYLVR